jgi:hypothetical protein
MEEKEKKKKGGKGERGKGEKGTARQQYAPPPKKPSYKGKGPKLLPWQRAGTSEEEER